MLCIPLPSGDVATSINWTFRVFPTEWYQETQQNHGVQQKSINKPFQGLRENYMALPIVIKRYYTNIMTTKQMLFIHIGELFHRDISHYQGSRQNC